MSKIKTAFHMLKSPGKIIVPLADRGFFNWMPDKPYLKMVYHGQLGKRLDLDNPQKFSEKLQWIKLYDRNPLYHTLVDKFEVKKYVANIIGDKYIIPTLGIWDDPEMITFDSLPEQFVLKCTHDSGSVLICKDKSAFDPEQAKKRLKKAINHSTYWFGREWPYKGLKPRIIAEPYLEDSECEELRDYKFFCFDGVVKCFKIDFDRFTSHHANYYNREGTLVKIGEQVCPPDHDKMINIPANINSMIELAEMLTRGYPFLRADFYDVNGHIYFGELTFFPDSGMGKFTYEDNDMLLGSWITLPKGKQEM